MTLLRYGSLCACTRVRTAFRFLRNNQRGGFVQVFQVDLEQGIIRDTEQFPELAGGEVDRTLEFTGEMALVEKAATGSDFTDSERRGGEELLSFGKSNFREKLFESFSGLLTQSMHQG